MDSIINYSDLFSSLDIISNKFLKMVKDFYEELMVLIKPESLVLTEGFLYDEDILKSAIAHFNEKPYENLYNMAKNFGTINQVDLKPFYLENIRKTSLELYPKL